jgi:septum formation protein
MLDDSDAVLAEAARVLRPDGVLLTTVDKTESHRVADGRGPAGGRPEDGLASLTARAARYGLELSGATTFAAGPVLHIVARFTKR